MKASRSCFTASVGAVPILHDLRLAYHYTGGGSSGIWKVLGGSMARGVDTTRGPSTSSWNFNRFVTASPGSSSSPGLFAACPRRLAWVHLKGPPPDPAFRLDSAPHLTCPSVL